MAAATSAARSPLPKRRRPHLRPQSAACPPPPQLLRRRRRRRRRLWHLYAVSNHEL